MDENGAPPVSFFGKLGSKQEGANDNFVRFDNWSRLRICCERIFSAKYRYSNQDKCGTTIELSFCHILRFVGLLFKKKLHLYLELDLLEAYVAPKRHHAKKNL